MSCQTPKCKRTNFVACPKCNISTLCKECFRNFHYCNGKNFTEKPDRKNSHIKKELQEQFSQMNAMVQDLQKHTMKKQHLENQEILNQTYNSHISVLETENQKLHAQLLKLRQQLEEKSEDMENIKKNTLKTNQELRERFEALEMSMSQKKMMEESPQTVQKQIQEIQESERKIKDYMTQIKEEQQKKKMENLSKGKSSVVADPTIDDVVVMKSTRTTLKASKDKKNSLKKALSVKPEESK